MKTIANANDACCITCFVGRHAQINDKGQAVCEHCGSNHLIDQAGEIFQPIYGDVVEVTR